VHSTNSTTVWHGCDSNLWHSLSYRTGQKDVTCHVPCEVIWQIQCTQRKSHLSTKSVTLPFRTSVTCQSFPAFVAPKESFPYLEWQFFFLEVNVLPNTAVKLRLLLPMDFRTLLSWIPVRAVYEYLSTCVCFFLCSVYIDTVLSSVRSSGISAVKGENIISLVTRISLSGLFVIPLIH
jgi:hypothetical protein